MGTRSRINHVTKDGKYKSVYCNFNGYLGWNGRYLLKYYNTPRKVTNLIKLGDMSHLDRRSGCPKGHTFDDPAKGYSVFYGRDRGETDVGPAITDEPFESTYTYLYKDNIWYVTSISHKGEYFPLNQFYDAETDEMLPLPPVN